MAEDPPQRVKPPRLSKGSINRSLELEQTLDPVICRAIDQIVSDAVTARWSEEEEAEQAFPVQRRFGRQHFHDDGGGNDPTERIVFHRRSAGVA
ncbi:hypothetical protein [Pararhizobium haloflavum]|uniref:hypothetical protein n=1 Tax=Pararhizobium haloflavum TaxID=2037914 RepID=UPI0013000200|nr:hypothetical protein [Pararhizobium haloflavum]